MTAVVERLEKAKTRIIDDGWYQGDYIQSYEEGSKCGVCPLGAIENWRWEDHLLKHDLASYNQDVIDARDLLEKAMREIEEIELDPFFCARFIPAWNDKPGRTVEEVIQAFDRAIELAVEQESNE